MDLNRDQSGPLYNGRDIDFLMESVRNPTARNKNKAVIAMCGVTDPPENSIAGRAKKGIELVWAGDKQAWADLLFREKGGARFAQLKSLSPFAADTVIMVSYSVRRTASFYGNTVSFFASADEMSKAVQKAIEAKKWITYAGDDYVVVFFGKPSAILQPSDVFWIGCNGGQKADTPETAKRKAVPR